MLTDMSCECSRIREISQGISVILKQYYSTFICPVLSSFVPICPVLSSIVTFFAEQTDESESRSLPGFPSGIGMI